VISSPSDAKTLMFLSVDIVDSTKFKELSHDETGSPAWLDAFEAFFRDLPLVFMGQIAATFADADQLPNVTVWKVMGDELIFRAQPQSGEEALRLTEAFYRTLVTYGSSFFERWSLRFRGCCWAARFPAPNIEFRIPEMAGGDGSADGAYSDYLGPDIDLGFRLAHHGGRGQLIISLNLAEAIAKALVVMPDQRNIRFHNVGSAVLKGVFNGRPYPLIMITVPDCGPAHLPWETEGSNHQRATCGDPQMEARKLIELAERSRSDLNEKYHLNLTPLVI
jgi:hypothetical protein